MSINLFRIARQTIWELRDFFLKTESEEILITLEWKAKFEKNTSWVLIF